MSNAQRNFKPLPSSLLFGAKRLTRRVHCRGSLPNAPDHVRHLLGVRRINDQCVELETQNNDHRNGGATFVGQAIVLGGAILIAFLIIGASIASTPNDDGSKPWGNLFIAPVSLILFSVLGYYMTGARRSRGAFIRLHRETRKLYYIAPGKSHMTVLDWDEVEPMVGFVPLASVSGYNALFPLYLVGVDMDGAQPAQVCLACGNKGVRDDGEAARWLWDYLQTFMAEGATRLPKPPVLPPRLTRKETFLRHFQRWSGQFRADLSEPNAKPWGFLRIPGKLIWLIVDVFPEALGDWLQYNVPYTPFPQEIDDLCGMTSESA